MMLSKKLSFLVFFLAVSISSLKAEVGYYLSASNESSHSVNAPVMATENEKENENDNIEMKVSVSKDNSEENITTSAAPLILENEVKNEEAVLDVSDLTIHQGQQTHEVLEEELSVENSEKKWAINFRYLGVLTQIGVERKLGGRVSGALYYGRYQGKVAGTDDLGLIPDLHHAALQTNIYLGSEGLALSKGPVIRFGVHANQQKNNALVKSVQVDGVDVIVPGQTRYGTLLGLGYFWQYRWLSASIGAEYLTLGPLKNLVPIAASIGVAF